MNLFRIWSLDQLYWPPSTTLWACASRMLWFWTLHTQKSWFGCFSLYSKHSFNVIWESSFRWLLWFWWMIFLGKTHNRNDVRHIFFFLMEIKFLKGLSWVCLSMSSRNYSNDSKTYITISYWYDHKPTLNLMAGVLYNVILSWFLTGCLT